MNREMPKARDGCLLRDNTMLCLIPEVTPIASDGASLSPYYVGFPRRVS
jgi:hypothetical protein